MENDKFLDYCNFLSSYYDPKTVSLLGSWKDCIDSCKIKILHAEQTVYSPQLGVAGTLDAVGYFDDALTIFDWKTGGMNYSYWLQLEMYRRCWTWMHNEEPVARAIVQLDPSDGTWKLYVRPLELNTQIVMFKDRRKKIGDQLTRKIEHFDADHEIDFSAAMASRTLYNRSKLK